MILKSADVNDYELKMCNDEISRDCKESAGLPCWAIRVLDQKSPNTATPLSQTGSCPQIVSSNSLLT